MPKVSKKTGKNNVMGPAQEWVEVLDGYEASIVQVTEDADLKELLKGLPDDCCPCPHWGYVFKGKLTFTNLDGTVEVFEEGDAFYTPPGHTPAAAKGCEFLIFSPAEQAAEVAAAMQRNAARLQNA